MKEDENEAPLEGCPSSPASLSLPPSPQPPQPSPSQPSPLATRHHAATLPWLVHRLLKLVEKQDWQRKKLYKFARWFSSTSYSRIVNKEEFKRVLELKSYEKHAGLIANAQHVGLVGCRRKEFVVLDMDDDRREVLLLALTKKALLRLQVRHEPCLASFFHTLFCSSSSSSSSSTRTRAEAGVEPQEQAHYTDEHYAFAETIVDVCLEDADAVAVRTCPCPPMLFLGRREWQVLGPLLEQEFSKEPTIRRWRLHVFNQHYASKICEQVGRLWMFFESRNLTADTLECPSVLNDLYETSLKSWAVFFREQWIPTRHDMARLCRFLHTTMTTWFTPETRTMLTSLFWISHPTSGKKWLSGRKFWEEFLHKSIYQDCTRAKANCKTCVFRSFAEYNFSACLYASICVCVIEYSLSMDIFDKTHPVFSDPVLDATLVRFSRSHDFDMLVRKPFFVKCIFVLVLSISNHSFDRNNDIDRCVCVRKKTRVWKSLLQKICQIKGFEEFETLFLVMTNEYMTVTDKILHTQTLLHSLLELCLSVCQEKCQQDECSQDSCSQSLGLLIKKTIESRIQETRLCDTRCSGCQNLPRSLTMAETKMTSETTKTTTATMATTAATISRTSQESSPLREKGSIEKDCSTLSMAPSMEQMQMPSTRSTPSTPTQAIVVSAVYHPCATLPILSEQF